MKKMMMISAFFAAITVSAFAQKIDAAKVPVAVKTAFAKQYPGVAAKWEKEAGMFEAGFKEKGHAMSALYDAGGMMKESEMEIKIADLPASVAKYVNENYKGKKIKESAKITKADGTVNYEAEVSGKDLIFDANGKFIKAVKD